MESDGNDRRAAVAAQVELLLVRLRFLEARHPGAVERAAREFEREAGGQPGARVSGGAKVGQWSGATAALRPE